MLCSCNSQPSSDEENPSDTLNLSEPSETVVSEYPTTTPDEDSTEKTSEDSTSEPSEELTSSAPVITPSVSSEITPITPQTSTPVLSEAVTTTAEPLTCETTTEQSSPTDVPELVPLEAEGEPVLIGISSTSVSRIVYTYSQNTTLQNYKNEFVTLKNPSLKKEVLSHFNGLVYVPVVAEKREAEALDYEKWKEKTPDAVLVPETITLYDYNGREIISFYSDAISAVTASSTPTPYVRAKLNGVEYELFYGELNYDKLQFAVTNAVLIQSGAFTLQTYSSVASGAISAYSSELISTTASSYRLYPPDAPIISTDGTVIYPSEFSQGTLLVDCIYNLTDGGTLTVTLNTKDAEIIRIEAVC